MFNKYGLVNDYRPYVNRSSLIKLKTENYQWLSIFLQLNEAVI